MYIRLFKAFLLTFLLSICAMPAFSAGQHRPGFIDGTDLIDGESSEVSPDNRTLKIRSAFFGEAAYAGLTIEYLEAHDELDPAFKGFIVTNIKKVMIFVGYIYNILLVFLVVGVIQIAIKAILDLSSGSFFGRYHFSKLIGWPAVAFVMILPVPVYNIPIASYLLIYSLNIGLQGEQWLNNAKLALDQRGGLDTYKANDESKDKDVDERLDDIQNRQTRGKAESMVEGMLEKAMVLTRSSQIRNSYYVRKEGFNNVFEKPSDLMSLDGGYYYVSVNNPENPSEKIFSLNTVIISNAQFNLSAASDAMARIDYANKYATADDIQNSLAISQKLDNDIREFGVTGEEGKYRAVSNTAKTLLFRDIRANWIRKSLPAMMDTAQNNAVIALNALCARNQQVRDQAAEYIKSGGVKGSVECVGANKQVMGTQPAETYDAALKAAKKAQADVIFNQLMTLNTSYMQSVQTDELTKKRETVSKCGSICFILNNTEMTDASTFNKNMLSRFANEDFVSLYENNAVGDYAITDFFRDKTGFRFVLQLPVEAYLKKQANNYTQALPNLSGEEAVQKALTQNSMASLQDNSLVKAQKLAFEMPDREFRKMIMSNQSSVRSFNIYGQGVAASATQILEVALFVKAAAKMGTAIVSDKEGGTKKESVAEIGGSSKKGKPQSSMLENAFSLLDSVADTGIDVYAFAMLFANLAMFLVVVIYKYIPLTQYLLFNFYSMLSILFIVYNAITVFRSNDDNNFNRISKNIVATYSFAAFGGPAILFTFIVSAEISDIMIKAAMSLVFQYMSAQYLGGDVMKYLMTMITLVITFYCVAVTSLIMQLSMLANIFRALGFHKHVVFMQQALEQVDSLIGKLHYMNFGMLSLIKVVAGVVKKFRI